MDCFRYGGLSKMMNWLAGYLTEQGNGVTLCSVYHSDYTDRLGKNVKFVSFEIAESTSKIKRNTSILIKKCRKFYELILKEKFDLVLSVGDPCLYFVLLFRGMLDYKVVVAERVDPYHCRGMGDRLKRKLYYSCDGFVFQTVGARDFFKKDIIEHAIVIPNPVVPADDVPRWDATKADKSIVYVGRYDPVQKRSDIMFRAFSEILKVHSDFVLEVYGGGYDNAAVKAQCEQLNIHKNVRFNGVTNDVYRQLVKSSIFLFTSDFEGIPNAVIEAMMVGIPIVATDCSPGGARMLLVDGEYGYLAECGNAKSIAKQVCYVIEHMDEAIAKANKCPESLKRFDASEIGRKWENYLKSIVGEREEKAK
jgi:group 1 family glycosyl transferase